MKNFESMNLPISLLRSLDKLKIKKPTEIQAKAIPLALQGEDILATSQTGTGKTLAFLVPLLTRLISVSSTKALILVPTRELAMQIFNVLEQLAFLDKVLLIGGMPIFPQLRKLKKNPRIIIGTPGRVNDHLTRKALNLSSTCFLVLDEADRMIDMGFSVQIDQIISFLPKERQTMLFSATVANNLEKLANKYLKNFKRISSGQTKEPVKNIQYANIFIDQKEKYSKMLFELRKIKGTAIMFMKTKHGVENMVKKLKQQKMSVDALHGDLKQTKRTSVLNGFRKMNYNILVATDVASRGLDVPNIDYVINYDLPMTSDDYIHRIGRTARAGASGHAINFITKEENKRWKSIQHSLNPKQSKPQKQFLRKKM